jgi:hypothetical protein
MRQFQQEVAAVAAAAGLQLAGTMNLSGVGVKMLDLLGSI